MRTRCFFRTRFQKCGFTLIEMLVVVAVVTLLLSLVLSAVQTAREASRHSTCKDRMRQLGIGVLSYEARLKHLPVHKGRFAGLVHWHYVVLPEMGEAPLHAKVAKEIEAGIPWDGLTGSKTIVPAFLCPSDANSNQLHRHSISGVFFAPANYLGVVGQSVEKNDGAFPSDYGGWPSDASLRLSQVTDGLSNTFGLCERGTATKPLVGSWQSSQEYGHQAIGLFERPSAWGSPFNFVDCSSSRFSHGWAANFCSQFHPWSYHGNGVNFVKLDGSVFWIPYSIDEFVLRAYCTRAGGESAPE
ncbi:DUF1559 domain-containing protein [Pirellulaceae bacterium SH501]